MVVQSVAFPKVTGSTSDDERPVEAAPAAPRATGSLHGAMLVLTLVATQIAWLALLGYGAFHLFG